MRTSLLSLCFAGVALTASAQHYNPREAFAPDFYTSNGNSFRSANGAPGGNYWQNKVDYRLNVSFDTTSNILSGTEEINYINNSPDNLDYLWFELDQNNDREDSRAHALAGAAGLKVSEDKGFKFKQIQVFQNGEWQNADYLINDTRMQLRLKNALAAKSTLKIRIAYSFKLLKSSAGDRAGILETKNGKIYDFGYWFPRLCVYDDLLGWNTLPFIGSGEFYFEYGDIDYKITAPANMLAVGSGELLNGNEVFNSTIINNIAEAKKSEKTVIIRSAEDVEKGISPTKKSSGNVTWHFAMKNTRDVAFALSKAFIYDGAKTDLPSGKTVFSQSVYPVEGIKGKSDWTRATEYLKASVEDFSKRWFEFPYPEAVNVGGPIGGMEFPALAFDHYKGNGKGFWSLVSHEIGHTWYPMIDGSNERRYPFMDEGFNTFIDIYSQRDFNNGEFAPKRDGEYAPKGGNPADEIVPVIKALQNGATLLTPPDWYDSKDVHPLAYFKAAFGLVLLRDVILDSARFDYAFRTYSKNWAFKHPSPTDFFRTMDNAAGEDLTWFWRGWFANNWLLDQAITSVKYKDDDVSKGALVTIENKEQLPMPVSVEIKEENGKTQTIHLPVEIWQRSGTWTLLAPTTSKVTDIILDPQHQLPDIDRSNNEWKG
ncbi:peptidase M1 [Arachidicoccus ginsenosidimutans]|uniref:M1 family metallopeptidase n=1 Tax=Arachidicoccus sp. BS20 TaxID=1850526 RepID=UPI0007F08C90|nr:M1 family metallopeptidase [Arachidicoccus sp. BS20]ANI88600.1 peptidase M1 [Arachidicoccus sp. BS20]